MEHITSLKNPKVAAWKALKDRKGRRESGCFLVEGRKMVEEALASAFDVETVLVQEGMELPDGLTVPVYELPEHVLAAVCDTKTPQGIAAVVRMKEQSALGKPATSAQLSARRTRRGWTACCSRLSARTCSARRCCARRWAASSA